MKKVLLLCFITLNLGWIKAQTHPIFGEEFNLDTSIEENPQIVLQDNYNHYLATVTSKGKLHIIFRKFDQQNQLVDTYTQDYAINPNTLHNVKGTFQVDANRVVTFIESYSGKTKQAEVYQYVFDKSTSKFTSTVLGTYPFVSVSKSGTLYVTASQNGNYLGCTKITTRKVNQK
jgi:hypothetical protein